jgi:hypothetical protein
MILKDILNDFEDKKILVRLFKLYPDQKGSKDGYLRALTELRATLPKKTDMSILVEHFTDDKFDYESYDHICGIGKTWDDEYSLTLPESERRKDWAIEFTPWKEWLGMPIEKFTVDHYCKLDILCHCLWEMTFCGYSSKGGENKMKGILKRVKEVDAKIKNKPSC